MTVLGYLMNKMPYKAKYFKLFNAYVKGYVNRFATSHAVKQYTQSFHWGDNTDSAEDLLLSQQHSVIHPSEFCLTLSLDDLSFAGY